MIWVLCAAALAGGCAAPVRRPATRPVPTTQAADDRARWTLEQIAPLSSLPATQPATQPAGSAPLESLALFAQARSALLQNQRIAARVLLDRAIALDPYSFELYYALGQALAGEPADARRAIEVFQKAANLRPDDLSVRVQLARLLLAADDADGAIRQLRLGMLSPDYAQDADQAALADFLLARALQPKGFDRAALQAYQSLARRLEHPTSTMRTSPELMFLIARPELLWIQMGQLHEKLGEDEPALLAYEQAAEREKANLELSARIVRLLKRLGRMDDAERLAREVVARFRASSESLNVLRELYGGSGQETAVIDTLGRLHQEKPGEKAILFALEELLRKERPEAADRLLADAVRTTGGDIEIVTRLFNSYEARAAVPEAAKLLIDALAMRPESLRELGFLWAQLLRPSREGRLRLSDLQRLDVPPASQAAKQFWISRIADLWNRDALSRSSLEAAVRQRPPFPPAYRDLLNRYWQRPDWDENQKIEASQRLADQARQGGDAALAAELRGIMWLHRKEPTAAVKELTAAIDAGSKAPDVRLMLATALFAHNEEGKAEQLLWKTISDWPHYDDAYAYLFRNYLERGASPQAMKVLQTWLEADPRSINARLLQATVFFQSRRPDAAERILRDLFAEHPDNPEVVNALSAFYGGSNRFDRLVTVLEEERAKHPDNQEVAERLVAVYTRLKRPADAERVVDSLHKAAGNDADLLYYVAHLYTRIDQKEAGEQTLEQVLRIDAGHAAANNDLGYFWADEGRNLDRAEALVRRAVEAEPDNQSFLDSLGWVLYKRGQFEEARQRLEEAIGEAARPDPVVLDHLGDALYQLGRKDEAAAQWKRALQRLEQINADRDELRKLRPVLQRKINDIEADKPTQVAPFGAAATRPATNG